MGMGWGCLRLYKIVVCCDIIVIYACTCLTEWVTGNYHTQNGGKRCVGK